MAVQIFPEELLYKDREDDFILLLQLLKVDIRTKKLLLIEWCELTGAVLTHDMVRRVVGEAEVGEV